MSIKSIERIFIQDEYNDFAKLSGDFNPIHVDPEFSANSGFGKTVAHGIFLYSCLMKVVKESDNSPIKSSKIMFPAPTFTNVPMILEGVMDDVLKLRTYEKLSGQNTSEITIEFGENKPERITPFDFSTHSNRSGKALKIGDYHQTNRIFTPEDLAIYSKLSGIETTNDDIPEPLINGIFSTLLGINLPGIGTNYLKQETQYFTPAKFGQEVFARIEIINLRPNKKLVDLATICIDKDGNLIANGRALVSARDVDGAFV